MDKQYIYKLTFPSGKCYIGRTKDVDDRMYGHQRSAFHKNSTNSVHKAMRKYGEGSWSIDILAETYGEDTAQIIEESFIKKFDSVKKGYNDTYGGGGRNMWIDNPKLKKKQAETLRKKFSGKNNPMHGKKHSKSAIQKQKEKAKGRFSLEWYIDRNGQEEGTRLYEERRVWLKNRNLPKDENGKFLKKSEK